MTDTFANDFTLRCCVFRVNRARKSEDPKQDQGGGCRAEPPQPEHGAPCDQAGTQTSQSLQEQRQRQHQ